MEENGGYKAEALNPERKDRHLFLCGVWPE